jgi:acyl-CoA synthetase (AMP-forming)/AMP-acid ligase II
LLGAIRRHSANWLKLTPSVLRLLDLGDLSGLKTLVMVGEPKAATDLATWQYRGLQLLSLYGQSVNSKGCSFGNRNEPGCDVRQFGRPLCATPWVVSPHDPDILMPIGAEGELLLEGPCVSKWYLDNPEQNRMTFLHNPA